MKIRILITALALTLALPATAELFERITEGYEVSLSDVRLPHTDGGSIGYKPCADCEYRTTRVAVDARWSINGKAMTLRKFRERVASLRDPDNYAATVTHHIESNVIIEVSFDTFDSE
ncbi:MAG: hypothetical protein ACE5F8_06695 [Woeseiaceae bacterium]